MSFPEGCIFILANSANPDANAALFHLDLHCLPMYLLPVSRMKKVNPFKHSVLSNGPSANSAEPDQTPQNAASDQLSTICLQNVLLKFE